MRLVINGEERDVPPVATVAELLTVLGVGSGAVGVLHNGVVLSREHFETPVGEGDVLEIVRFVGGG